ncbi:Polyamine aminopropyltransferase [Aquicella siphonis]|uniref:Polyamine aminopropyltransferase n=1 Tax=Aquicella siphonis TaxID=254247 RepID=A0A5E4PEH0_9COXI|nr:polyamine aminopropyltransferase [Aquicella siphonis]VVC74817.1 Polyamine aminopropyltransferase [Aquicella siphonis]
MIITIILAAATGSMTEKTLSTPYRKLAMQERARQEFAVDITQKLYEKHSPHGTLAVYETTPYGKLLTLDGDIVLSEQDGFFYHEMLAHPALFSHSRPQHVAIVGVNHGILQEVLKHSSVETVTCLSENSDIQEPVALYFSHWSQETKDQRVRHHRQNPLDWFRRQPDAAFDIIIQTHRLESTFSGHYQYYLSALKPNGILVQPCLTSLIHYKALKPMMQQILASGFEECQTLNFPQPSHPYGSRTILMAVKSPAVKRIREKDIFNRCFTTRYYNLESHKAALALPEYVRQELDFAE